MQKNTFRISLGFFLVLFLISPLVFQAKEKGNKAQKDPFSELSLRELEFRSIGPALTSGRISDFAVNPQNRKEYYVAVSSGGVWKTTNAGTTYKSIFDKAGSYSIGCVTMDPNNHNVVWVGTGENNNQRSVAYGDGVYKTDDGGRTWKNMGLKDSEHIGMIIVDPRDSNVVYVAAYGPLWRAGGDRGLYKTTDGGKTWKAILTISEHTGVSEVHFDPRDPDVIYAVAHQRRRHVWTMIDGGPESGIHKSTDAGATWEKIEDGLLDKKLLERKNIRGELGRIGLAISPVNPDTIYAIVEAQAGLGGFFRSVNRGARWEKMSDYTSRGNYYQEIFCDPQDVERVYSMDVYLQVTDDGGKTWRNLGGRNKHVDDHVMWIDPEDTDYYLVGCDGGVYESFDRGKTWKYHTNLPVTQFYKVAVDNSEPFYFVYGGTQDNYSLGGPSRTISPQGIVNADWFTTRGGDGFESQIDPEDPNIVYAQSQYAGLVRYDKKSGETMGIKPKERKGEKSYRWNWDAPLLVSPHLHTRLYFAANKVFRSDDRGDTWEVISEDLTRQIDRNKLEIMDRVWPMDAVAKNASTSKYGSIVALDESPLQEGLLYVGTDDGLIQVSEDGGKNWRKIDRFPGVPDRTYVNEVLASQHEKDTVYAAFNNHKNGDFRPYVLKSTDAGRTWDSLTANLPKRGSVYALAEDHVNKDLLFAGTEFGLFVSIDGGKYWKQLEKGLPPIAVRDIAIQKRENDLVLATFGRSFYVLDDYTPLRHLSQDVLSREAYVFPVKDAWMYMESSRIGSSRTGSKGFQGEMYFAAKNPAFGATFTNYLRDSIKTLKDVRRKQEKETFDKGKPVPYPTYEQIKAEEEEETPYLVFTISDEEGTVVRRLRAPAAKGLHRIVWDLRCPTADPTSLGQSSPTSSGSSSTLALPGTYSVSMSKYVKGVETQLTEPVSFKAVVLGNTTLPAKDRAELIAFQKRVRELNRAVSASASILRDLDTKVKHFKVAMKSLVAPDKELNADILALEAKLREIRKKLSGDSTLERIDLDAEPGLTGRMRSLVYDQWRSTSAPTQTQRDAYEIVSEEFVPIQNALPKLVEDDVKKIEKRLEELGAPYTPGRLPGWKKN